MKNTAKSILTDLSVAILAGIVVGTANYFFQNSNGFAPGGELDRLRKENGQEE